MDPDLVHCPVIVEMEVVEQIIQYVGRWFGLLCQLPDCRRCWNASTQLAHPPVKVLADTGAGQP